MAIKKMQTGGAKKTVKKIDNKTSFKAGLKAGPETLKRIDDAIEKRYPNYTGPTSFYAGLKSGAKTLLGYKKGGVTKEHPLTAFRKANDARNAMVTKSLPKAQNGGAYVAWKDGQLTRNHNAFGPTESMDTTGYSIGKKEFDFNRSTYQPGKGTTTTATKVVRKDVPSKIAELKKGSDRTVIESKKNANKFTITEHKVKKPVSHPGNNGVTRKSGGETKSLPKAQVGNTTGTPYQQYMKIPGATVSDTTRIAFDKNNERMLPKPGSTLDNAHRATYGDDYRVNIGRTGRKMPAVGRGSNDAYTKPLKKGTSLKKIGGAVKTKKK